MTTLAIIVACIAFIIAAGVVRGKPGRGVADTALLVILLGAITFIHVAFSPFFDTSDAARSVAVLFAAGFALDALYGMMAPERQRQRDKKLRRLMKRRA